VTVWRYCTEVFDYLSLSAVIDDKVSEPRSMGLLFSGHPVYMVNKKQNQGIIWKHFLYTLREESVCGRKFSGFCVFCPNSLWAKNIV